MPENRNECKLKDSPDCFWERTKPAWEELDRLFKNQRIAVSDIDCEINIGDDFVRIEWKQPGQRLPTGQRLSLERWAYRMGKPSCAFVVEGIPRPMRPQRFRACIDGRWRPWQKTNLRDFKNILKRWEQAALAKRGIRYPSSGWYNGRKAPNITSDPRYSY